MAFGNEVVYRYRAGLWYPSGLDVACRPLVPKQSRGSVQPLVPKRSKGSELAFGTQAVWR